MVHVPAWNSTSSLGMFTEKLCLLFVIEHMVLSFLWCDEVDWGLGKYWKILKAVKLSFRNTVKLQYITNKIQQKDFFYQIRFNAGRGYMKCNRLKIHENSISPAIYVIPTDPRVWAALKVACKGPCKMFLFLFSSLLFRTKTFNFRCSRKDEGCRGLK